MTKLLGLLMFLGIYAHAASLPSLNLRNQYGEVQNDYILSGSGMIEVKFTVDATYSAGQRGITTIGGADAISQVYLNSTNATLASGSPNPSPGYIVVQFAKGYSGLLTGIPSFTSPQTSPTVSVTSGLTRGKPYEIYSVGTTTQAQWQALGLPSGVVATPSASFIAISSFGTGTGSATLAGVTGSTIDHCEMVGSTSLDLNVSAGTGQIILQCLAATSSSTTTFVPTAPVTGTAIHLLFSLTPQSGSQL